MRRRARQIPGLILTEGAFYWRPLSRLGAQSLISENAPEGTSAPNLARASIAMRRRLQPCASIICAIELLLIPRAVAVRS